MKNKIIIFLSFLTVFVTNGYAQKGLEKKANKQYDTYAYIDATKTYERVAEKGYKSVDLFEKLGNAYYFNNNYEQAAKWYGELFAMKQEVPAEYYYRYGVCLKSVGQYAKSDEMMVLFNQKNKTDLRGINYMENKDYLEVIKANSGRYTIKDAGINSPYSDYGSSISDKKLVFTSARDTGNFAQRIYKWNNTYFTNLYAAKINEGDSLGTPVLFAKKVKTKFHESTPVFTKDGKTMYFTRNNYNDGKRGRDENKVTLLKIYKATLIDSQWVDIVELPFNSNDYSTAHPCLSPDEKTLYFASDRKGSYGQSDLFKVAINDDGTYGEPINLGPIINSEGKESFPFVSNENELYFASNGIPGLGGLDIYVSKINADGTFTKPINIGAPANSAQDDFGYLIDTKTGKGFLTSNREGGKGDDDIYAFVETKRLETKQELSGMVIDLDTGEILPDAKVTLFDENFNKLSEVVSNEKGLYNLTALGGTTVYIKAEKEGYKTTEQKVNLPPTNGKTNLPIALQKTLCQVAVGDNLGKCFDIKIIYFDLNKSDIRPEAAIELEKILDVMKQYPNMKIDVRSHTDSRASFKYNEKLSDRRAKATIVWLIENGANPANLSGKGYGETQLVNDCSDGVPCTEEQHQANRRSEFIITAM